MPRRAKERKHPVDVIAAVVEQADFPADDGKNKAAQWLRQRGGKARAKALSSPVEGALITLLVLIGGVVARNSRRT